jgi:uncharacterized protein YbbK (DUF523 family)
MLAMGKGPHGLPQLVVDRNPSCGLTRTLAYRTVSARKDQGAEMAASDADD